MEMKMAQLSRRIEPAQSHADAVREKRNFQQQL